MSNVRSTNTKKLLAISLFSVAFLVTRIPFLGYDEINPDAVNWHLRSEQFIVGLKSGNFLKTYQHYHPGVTLMWLTGTPIEIARQVNPSLRIYNQDNFIQLHKLAKYTLVLVQLVLSIILILTLKDILGYKKSLLAVSIFSFEPFFLGNSRILHMDVLLTLLISLSLIYGYKYYLRRSIILAIISGIFAGLAFLTKSVGALAIIFVPTALLILDKKCIKTVGVVLGTAMVTTFVLFPALWVKPVFVLTEIYNEGLRVGTRRGHEQVIMGYTIDSAGPGFYPLVLALKTSPLIWLGVGFTIYLVVKHGKQLQKADKTFLLYLTLFYLIYFLGVSLASKKIDRYILPLFPLLGIISAIGINQALVSIRDRYYKITLSFSLLLVTGIGILYPLLKLYPYYFTYSNPVFGPAEQANNIVGQKPFGIGIPELKNRLVKTYGEASLGFIDKKPMSMIYPNSKLFDIRETGVKKYDLIILGPNEIFPENVMDSKTKFIEVDAMYINDLEYWRVYKKTP